MSTIWKYLTNVAGEVVISMPLGAEILHVADLGPAMLHVWARVDPTAPLVDRHFVIVGTGNPCPAVGSHVASVVTGPFVWHVFEGVTENPQDPRLGHGIDTEPSGMNAA